VAAIPADGSGFGIETDRGLTGCCDTVVECAPADTMSLVKPYDLAGHPLPQLLWDPRTGEMMAASRGARSDPA
jgi:hypothetical protein